IRDIGGRDDNQNPADDFLPAQGHPDQTDWSLVRVMRGLDPRIHLLRKKLFEGGWIAGSSPAMTAFVARYELVSGRSRRRGRSCAPALQIGLDAREILVAATGQVDDHEMFLRLLRGEVHDPCQRVRRLERGDDTFEPRAELERGERLLVRR